MIQPQLCNNRNRLLPREQAICYVGEKLGVTGWLKIPKILLDIYKMTKHNI